jgi:hypothetical protein
MVLWWAVAFVIFPAVKGENIWENYYLLGFSAKSPFNPLYTIHEMTKATPRAASCAEEYS